MTDEIAGGLATDGLIVAPIRDEHIVSFHQALDTVSREQKYLTFLEAPPLDSTRDFIRGMIAGGHPQFVALDGDVVVGWCDIRRHDRPSHAHRGTLGMGIIPGYRDRGLGTRLISATLDQARAIGLHRVELDVHADNLRAVALYEKVGFVREGVARDAVFLGGRYVDSIGMAILFA